MKRLFGLLSVAVLVVAGCSGEWKGFGNLDYSLLSTNALSFNAFRAHLADALDREQEVAQGLSSSASLSAMGDMLGDLGQWADEELAWLSVNPPAACYKKGFDTYEKSMTLFRDGVNLGERAIPLLDADMIRRGTDKIQESISYLHQVDIVLDGEATACGAKDSPSTNNGTL